MPRVRHHTNDAGLDAIRARMAINPSRGDGGFAAGVHVEVEPFGTTKLGINGPRSQLGAAGEGAYVEFDAPAGMIPTFVGPRNTAMIPTGFDEPLSLIELNPHFVKVRRYFYEFWRTKPE